MKQILLILFSAPFLLLAQAQDYQPLVVENANWVVSVDLDETTWVDTWHSYKITEDTMANSLMYKKVIYRDLRVNEATHEVIYPYDYYNEELIGLIREDLGARTVHFVKVNSSHDIPPECVTGDDVVLYNFTLQLGAGESYCHYPNTNVVVLTEYEDFPTLCGLLPTYNWGDGMLIEKIGSQYGLLENPVPNTNDGFDTWLEDYCVGTDEECAFSTPTGEAISPQDMPVVAPNPFDKVLTINNLSNWKQLRIVDALGRVITELSVQNNSKELDGNLFPMSGIYYLQVANETQNATILVVKM